MGKLRYRLLMEEGYRDSVRIQNILKLVVARYRLLVKRYRLLVETGYKDSVRIQNSWRPGGTPDTGKTWGRGITPRTRGNK